LTPFKQNQYLNEQTHIYSSCCFVSMISASNHWTMVLNTYMNQKVYTIKVSMLSALRKHYNSLQDIPQRS
jgi:hypothetical protein